MALQPGKSATIRGGKGLFWSVQVTVHLLKTKKKTRKKGAWRSHNLDGTRNERYTYEDDFTYKIQARYSRKFLNKYGNKSSNRMWGQFSAKKNNYMRYVRTMEKYIQKDIEKMIRNNDGLVIRRKPAFIQDRYLWG